MKTTLKIASLSLVLSVIAATGAHAAASVRSFGGTGVHNGTASAVAEQKASVGAPVRAGSVRVTPSIKKAGTVASTKTSNSTVGRAATAPRLSVGSHLGSNAIITGGSDNRGGSTAGTAGISVGEKNVVTDENDALRITTDLGTALKSCNSQYGCIAGHDANGNPTLFEVVNNAVTE